MISVRKWFGLIIRNEWIFLFLMGSIMAGLSFLIDEAIEHLQESHYIFYKKMKLEHLGNFAGYIVWVIFPMTLVFVSVFSTKKISPAAVGSGIPEMKTILRSPTIHKEYIKARVLIAKLVGLILALGSRLPVGKEGKI
jgi:chloride channel 2